MAPKLAAETGDTLSITGKVEAAAFKFPNSQYRIAIEAENRGDEEKLYTFIEKACKADPTMSIDRDEETGQTTDPRIWAGGDIVTGAATVILAMGAGKKAAASITKSLLGE